MSDNFEKHFQTYTKAVFERDLNLFLSIFDENIQAFDMWEKWSHKGINEWKAMTKEWFDSLEADSEKCVVEFSEVTESISGDLGYATSFVKFQAQNSEGKIIRYMDNRLTWVLEKKSGAWKIIHQHTSSPIDQTTKAIFQR